MNSWFFLDRLHWQIAVLTATIKMVQKNGCDAGQHKRVSKTSKQFKASFQMRFHFISILANQIITLVKALWLAVTNCWYFIFSSLKTFCQWWLPEQQSTRWIFSWCSSNSNPATNCLNRIPRTNLRGLIICYNTQSPIEILRDWWTIRRKLRQEYLTEMTITLDLIQEQARQFSQNNHHVCHHVFRHVLPTHHMFQAPQRFATQVHSRLKFQYYYKIHILLSETNSIEVSI